MADDNDSNDGDDSAGSDSPTWAEYAEEKFEGFPDLYDKLGDVMAEDTETATLISSMWKGCGGAAEVLFALKIAYVLGVYNQERGLHATKH